MSTARLPDTWSKTQNVEWTASIPGRGWSSPIVSGGKVFVTAATTDGASKKPQIGTQYSNDYVAELQKQGLSEKEIDDRVTARDFELPDEVNLHYFLYCVDLKSGKVTGSGSTTQASRQAGVTARTVSPRRRRSPTGSWSTSTRPAWACGRTT